jgi:FHS family Na+ dependent glucose MFS transporter 1
VLCLEIWDGLNGGPYMHSMHFSFSVGALLAPVIAKPFLSASHVIVAVHLDQSVTVTGITYLFPLAGLCLFTSSLTFLTLGIMDLQKSPPVATASTAEAAAPTSSSFWTRKNLLVALTFLFAFLCIGLEYCLILYIPAFGVISDYKLTKAEGADLLGLFLATFTAGRCFSILLATRLAPNKILLLNITLVTVGVALQLVAGEENLLLTRVGYGIVGWGEASMFAGMWMWLKQYLEVTSGMVAFINVGLALGMMTSSLLVGMVIEAEPLVLVYLQAGTVATLAVIILAGSWVGLGLLKQKAKLREDEMSKQVLVTELMNQHCSAIS